MNHYLTEAEQGKLLATIGQYREEKAQRDFHIVSALIASGLRIGEFLLVTVGDVYAALDTNYLYIPAANRKGGKRDHSVYLTKTLRRDLSSLLAIRESIDAEHYLVAGRNDQTPMSARNLQQRVKAWAKEAGLAHLDITPHYFRHTAAMNLLRHSSAREPLRVVKSALGHRNINSTSIYTEASREEVAEAMNAADQGRQPRITLAQLRREYQRRTAA